MEIQKKYFFYDTRELIRILLVVGEISRFYTIK